MPFKLTGNDIVRAFADRFNIEILQTGFDSVVIETPVNQIDVNASEPANNGSIRLVTGGTVTDFNGEFSNVSEFTNKDAFYQINTNGNDGDHITVLSSRAGRYIPGFESLVATSFNLEEDLDDQHLVRVGYGLLDEADGSIIDGFYIEIELGKKKIVVRKGGQTVAEKDDSKWDSDPFSANELQSFTPSVFRLFFNWYGAGNVRPYISFTDDEADQENQLLDKLSNQDGYLTDEINLHSFVQIRTTESGSTGQTANVGSMEYKVRGQGVGSDRTKKSHEFSVTGGNISGTLTGIKALRIRTDVKSTANKFQALEFSPTDNMQVAAVAVDKSQLTLSDSDFSIPNLTSSVNNIVEEAPYSAIDQSEIPATVDEMNGARQLAAGGVQSGSKGETQTTGAQVDQFFSRFEYVLFVAKTDGATGADTDLTYKLLQEF